MSEPPNHQGPAAAAFNPALNPAPNPDLRVGSKPTGSSGADLARAALAAAKARARQLEEGQAGRRRGQGAGGRIPGPRRSGSGADERDPQTLEATLARLLAEAGWEAPAAVGGIIHGWADLVGPRIAAHCEPVSFDEGVLTVQADSSAWATELRNLSGILLAKLNASLPHKAGITRIMVLGPNAPTWKRYRPQDGGYRGRGRGNRG